MRTDIYDVRDCGACWGTGQQESVYYDEEEYRVRLVPVVCRRCKGTGER